MKYPTFGRRSLLRRKAPCKECKIPSASPGVQALRPEGAMGVHSDQEREHE
jgi:hypothetical protein